MLKMFPIECVRQALEQKLLEEHLRDVNLFGGKNQVNILSFYEQLKSQDEVDRFVETFRELSDQQNRTGLILNGVVVSPENPTITNLYSSLIIPLTYTCSLRCRIEDRDSAIITLNNLADKLKGRKVDVAQLNCRDENNKPYSTPFIVGTIGQGSGIPTLKNGDYIGEIETIADVSGILTNLDNKGVVVATTDYWLYCGNNGLLKVIYIDITNNTIQFIEDDGTRNDIIFPPEHSSFEKYKMSMSFDSLRCDEPRNLNAHEYCDLTFGGSATLVSNGVALGNDLLKVDISKIGIKAETDIDFTDPPHYYLEPLEMPSGNSANTQINQLISNKFISMSHTDSISLTLQYTFIYDKTIPLLKQLFKYGRYGTQGLTKEDISPNMLFLTNEIWCSWGEYEVSSLTTKLIENIDIENTESDTLTLSLTMQIQGEVE